jgi:peptidoglycan hydrolase CwlO-like protein
MSVKRLTSEQKLLIIRLRGEGKTYQEVADAVGVSTPTVGNVMRKAISNETKNVPSEIELSQCTLETKLESEIVDLESRLYSLRSETSETESRLEKIKQALKIIKGE